MNILEKIELYLNEKEETHVCKECGWEWKGTPEEWKVWKGPCPECGKPKSQFT